MGRFGSLGYAAWDRWEAEAPDHFLTLQRIACRMGVRAAIDALDDDAMTQAMVEDEQQRAVEDMIVDTIYPSDDYSAASHSTVKAVDQAQSANVIPPPPTNGLYGTSSWRPPVIAFKPAKPLPPPRPRHPIEDTAASLPAEGIYLQLTREVARQIAGWWVGRPHTEWSARALIKPEMYNFKGKQTWRGTCYELFLSDDTAPDAVRDTSTGTTQRIEWEAGLIDTLLTTGREEAIDHFIGHAHSHHSMGAFWSSTDDAMMGMLLDDQSALGSRLKGYVVALVIGEGLSIRCRIDMWDRLPNGTIEYAHIDKVPVRVKWPKLINVADVLAVRKKPAPALVVTTPQASQFGYVHNGSEYNYGQWMEDEVDYYWETPKPPKQKKVKP